MWVAWCLSVAVKKKENLRRVSKADDCMTLFQRRIEGWMLDSFFGYLGF